MSPLIQILNPVPDGARFLGHRHACRYVKQRRAQWVGSHAIRFVESDHRHQSAHEKMREQTAVGYDGRGMLTLKEIRRWPTVGGDPVKVIIRRKPHDQTLDGPTVQSA